MTCLALRGWWPIVFLILLAACTPCAPCPPASGENSSANSEDARFAMSDTGLPVVKFDELATGKQKPPTMEELKNELSAAGYRWFFGQGIGRTATNVGIVWAFPPYAVYLVANYGLEAAGYRPLYVTDALGEDVRLGVLTVYDGFTGMPGFVNSSLAGQPYFGRDVWRKEAYTQDLSQPTDEIKLIVTEKPEVRKKGEQ